MADPTSVCFEAQPLDKQLALIYSKLTGEDMAISQVCFEGQNLDKQLALIYAATGLVGTFVEINEQTGDYTTVASDAGKLVLVDSASAVDIEIPPNSDVPYALGAQIHFARMGAGTVTFVEGSGVTIDSESGFLDIGAQYGAVTLIQVATDEWLLIGRLA